MDNGSTGTTTRVVVVDDHVMFAEGMKLALDQSDDVEVVGSASSVQEAVSVARVHRPDVLVMDYRLPDGTGIDAALRIREDLPTVQTVLVTGSVTDHILRQAVQTGCAGLLHKGEALSDVVRAVRAAQKGDLMISPGVVGRIHARPGGAPATVTDRQREVLLELARGRSASELADELSISYHTARNHIRDTLERLGARSQLEAVVTALRQGVISMGEL